MIPARYRASSWVRPPATPQDRSTKNELRGSLGRVLQPLTRRQRLIRERALGMDRGVLHSAWCTLEERSQVQHQAYVAVLYLSEDVAVIDSEVHLERVQSESPTEVLERIMVDPDH